MSPRKFNADILRAALRAAEARLKETLTDLEANDMDEQAMACRLREIEKSLRTLSFAA